ncbi:MAG TPA: hypothetical protein VN380_03980 [Thermoanaerobaculia bacterium]|nr:hypothetical protein [Thermoanaerobaculia bacterium]
MANTLTFTLTLLFTDEVKDSGGNWQYASATGKESTTGAVIQLIATKRQVHSGGVPFPASALTATLMFAAHGTGVSPNMTLQGVHDLQSNDETGSVSAASPTHADYIGGPFAFDSKKGLLTISPRKG